MLFPPTKRTTLAQWTVAAWTVITLLVVASVAGIYFSFHADLPVEAASLRRAGFLSIGLAALVWITKLMIAWFVG